MRKIRRARSMAQRGFTLIELVLVIVMITVASVPLFGLFTQATASLIGNENRQTAAQLAQEQAENILARRRSQGFISIAPGTTTEPGAYNAFNRTTVITQATGAPAGCPAATLCDQVVISVDNGGPVLAQVNLLLVDY